MNKSREKLLIFSVVAFVLVTMAFIAYLWYSRVSAKNDAPIITCASKELHVNVDATKEDLLTGVTAMDAEDGDLTSKVLIGSVSAFMEKGKCEITYAVFDSGKKGATAVRTLYYNDYHSPRFTLSDDLIYQAGETINPLRLIKAYDCIDGDITNRISMSWLDSDASSRVAEFRVINSMGDVSTLVANITTTEKATQNTPVIKLKNYIMYVEKGEMIDPLAQIASITVGRKIYTFEEFGGADKVYYDMGEFNSAESGTYRIGIYCENGEHTGATELLVVVED